MMNGMSVQDEEYRSFSTCNQSNRFRNSMNTSAVSLFSVSMNRKEVTHS